MDQATAAPSRSQFLAVDRVEGPDDLTVKFVTKYPFPDLLLVLAQPNFLAYDPAHTKKYSVKEYARSPVGTGPFMLKEWISGDRVVFVPNPNYWGSPPKVNSVTYKPVPEGAARAAMLRTGEADIAVKIPPEEVRNLEGDPNINVLKLDSMYQVSYELNNTKDNPPLSNKMVRQALNHAVDKEAIVKTILMGLGAPMVSPFGPGINFRATFEPYRYDPEKAKKMLAEAGYPSGFKLILNTPNGRYMKDREVTEAVQGYLRAVGVQAEVKVWEWSPYMTFIREDASREAMLLGRATPSADYTATRLFSKSAIGLYNVTGFWREKIEDLLVKARSSFNEKERAELYRQIQAIVWEEAPWVFLHNQKAVVGVRKNVTGFVMLPTETNVLANVSKQ
jgi:peptide/nickel transport system substrate-binding protein